MLLHSIRIVIWASSFIMPQSVNEQRRQYNYKSYQMHDIFLPDTDWFGFHLWFIDFAALSNQHVNY